MKEHHTGRETLLLWPMEREDRVIRMLMTITQIDVKILLFIQEHLRTPLGTAFWSFITLFAEHGIFWIAVTLLLVVIAKTRKAGICCMISIAIGYLISNIAIKNLVARPRPYDAFPQIIPLVAKLKDFSFPSGHTTVSFACTLVLLRFFPKKVAVPAVILAVLIALSRLYLGVHYPSDVIVGMIIGMISSYIAVRIMGKDRQPADNKNC